MFYRLLSSMIFCAGCVSFMNGIAIPVLADPACDGGDPVASTVCDPAHAIHRHLAQSLNVDCEGDTTTCTPGIDSQCGSLEGFQVAGKGLCVVSIQSSEGNSCTEDVYSTFVALNYFTTECGVKNGACTCLFVQNFAHPTQYSEVCDCM